MACAADCLHARLRKPELPDFTLRDEIFYCSRHVFDRHVRIDAMLIKQVDHIRPKTLERGLGNLFDVR